ncbi:hypothetical protein LIER_08810 [Lithospermum erythrorhizon]|uniref:Pentatricopeptide repeat-containing protein n=1 Tax=Lithospermum erythrorhizon TaxID=34254 RepID=A0AAV3PI46_LITER
MASSTMYNVVLFQYDASGLRVSQLPNVVSYRMRRGVFAVRVSSKRTIDENEASGGAGNVPESLPAPAKLASPAVTRLVAPIPFSSRTHCDPKSPLPKAVVQETLLSPANFGEEPVSSLGFDPFLSSSELKGSDADILSDNSGESEDIKEEGISEGYRSDDEIEWESEEIEAISSLFKGRIPQKPGKLGRKRPSPLSLPHKNRPLGLPSRKNIPKPISRQCILKQVYKNPSFLIQLAKQIKDIPEEEDVSSVLNRYARFLRKGSLSMTVRELGHLGLPERALQVFSWAQQQPHMFPDDRILASTVEVLARAHELKVLNLDKFIRLASKSVYEAMVRGFIKGGNLKLACKLLHSAKEGKRILDASVYSKLILELAKNPDKSILVLNLLEELAEREHLNLSPQDCTAVMKSCVRLEKYEIVEVLYDWFRKSGSYPSIVMYTTLIHSRFSEKKYREAMAIIWEMEASSYLLDLPAYRVAIKLFVALNDLPRTVRYFSKLKEAGFSPTFDIYRNVFQIYASYGRQAKCRDICREAGMAGFHLEENIMRNSK